MLSTWAVIERHHAQKTEQQRVVELFESRLTHASLLAKGEDYSGAKAVLKETDALDNQVSPSLVHARNLLHSFTQIKGSEAEQVYKGAGYALLTVAVSPDGSLVAAGGEHGTLVVFDAKSGKLLQRLEGHATEGASDDLDVWSIAFSSTGQQLISAGRDKKIIIWQQSSGAEALPQSGKTAKSSPVKTWTAVKQLNAPDTVMAISVSPDGTLLASGGSDNNISLWDLSSGKPLRILKQHTQSISERGLAFNPDGQYLASGSYDGTAVIWQVAKGKPLKTLKGHTGAVYGLSFSADSQWLATTSSDKTLRLWCVATGELLRVFSGHQNTVFTVAWLGDKLSSGSFDRTIRLWDSQSGVSERVLQGHDSGVGALALHSGKLWSASNDGTVRRWAVSMPFQQTQTLPSEPNSTAITPSLAQIAVGFANGDLELYDSQNIEPLWQRSAVHSSKITRLSVNHDGTLLASGSIDTAAKLWAIRTDALGSSLEETRTLSGHERVIHAVAFSPDAQTLATASYDGSIGLFPLTDGKPPRFINNAHDGKVESVEFDATGKQLLSSGYEDRSLKLWDLTKNPATATNFPLAQDNLLWASISPDGQKLVSVGREFAVNAYDRHSTQQLYHLTGHENTVYRAVFAPDSQQLATVSMDTTLKFWQLEQGKELFSLALPTEFTGAPSVWDLGFRCLNAECLVAVPLVRGVLQTYRLGYGQKLTEDEAEQKRQQRAVLRDYQTTVSRMIETHALQAAAQALRETEEIQARYEAQFPQDPAFAPFKAKTDCQKQWLTVATQAQPDKTGQAKPGKAWTPERKALTQEAGAQALPVKGGKTANQKTENKAAQDKGAANTAQPTLSVECQIILDDSLSPADKLSDLAMISYKQQRYTEAQAQYALALQKFPYSLSLLSNDAELALVQGDTSRLQQRLQTMLSLYAKKDGVYLDKFPAIMGFLNYLSDAKQTPEAVLGVIEQTGETVTYGWDFSDMQPVLDRQDPSRQQTAALFVDFFKNKIDLDTLKAKLKDIASSGSAEP